MSVGSKIKYIRNLRGLTQKELGIKAGFSATTADVRIRQYESNKMIPKIDKLKDIADALDVDPQAISNPDITSYVGVMHVLFELEERFGLRIEYQDNHFYLDFAEKNAIVPHDIMSNYIKLWYKEIQNSLPEINDSPGMIEQKKKSYELWKFRFPSNKVEHDVEMLNLYGKKHRLEKELKEINEKLADNK